MKDIVYFWNGFEPLLRIVVVGTITYIGIILLLRVSGKRTLASMNAFDFIITVAMGSAFGRILTTKQVSIAEALITFILLISLQYLVSFLKVRSKTFSDLLTSQPVLLYYQDQFLEKKMKQERISKDSLLGAVRQNNINDLAEVEAIVLETNGAVSVIKKGKSGSKTVLEDIEAV